MLHRADSGTLRKLAIVVDHTSRIAKHDSKVRHQRSRLKGHLKYTSNTCNHSVVGGHVDCNFEVNMRATLEPKRHKWFPSNGATNSAFW